ncbi:MAG: 2'-5' RNA ligase family protein, partial [Gaiellaceae bacterium]
SQDAGLGETAIVALVPEAEPVVGGWRRVHTDDGRRGMPAHVTVLSPFVDDSVAADRIAAVRRTVSAFAPFDCAFAETARFAGDVLYLRPEPDEIFRAMTAAIVHAFPDFPPYSGLHDDAVPHLTVVESDDHEALVATELELRDRLPIGTWVSAVSLMHLVDGRWREHTSVPLG